MAKTYTATLEVESLKEHTCSCCGAVYAYNLHRKVKGTAGTAEKARAAAQKLAARALEREVDLEPCATCGLLQPDMVGQTRARRHKIVFWLALIVFIAIVIARSAYWIQSEVAIWSAAVLCAVTAFALWGIDFADPNKDPEANRERAAGRVTSGVVAHKPGQLMTGERDLARFPRSLGHKMTLVMVGVAVVLAAAPELVRVARHWPLNDEAYPPVVGPGDQARIYMRDTISSIKGYWRGKPTAKVHAEGSSAPAVMATASTNQNDWGSTISAKSSEKSSSSTPWVAVTFPSDAGLAGKDVTCDVALHVNYPHFTGSSSFQTMSASMNRNLTLHLAPTIGAGGSYNEWWWEGTVGGMGLMLLCALLLLASARGLQKRAEPTRLLGPRAAAPVPVGPPPPPPVGQAGVPV